MYVAPKIDWLTLTKPYDGDKDAIPTNVQDAHALATMIAQSHHSIGQERVHLVTSTEAFYPWQFATEKGAVISISPRQSQGVRVVWTGQALPVGQSDQALLWRAVRAESWRITRCDIALDVVNSGVSVIDHWTGRLEERAMERRGKAQLILNRNGDTILVGSRTSDRYIRIYDKAKEQKRQGDWVRIEIEIKGKAAHNLKCAYKDLLRRSTAAMIAMLYKTPATVLEAMQAIADGADPIKSPPKETSGNREIWLMEQVLPALKKTKSEQPETFNRFIQALIDLVATPG